MSEISNYPVGTGVSIVDLPGIVTGLFARAQLPLSEGPDKQVGLFVRYLRRKPARGLAGIYAVDELGRRGAGRAHEVRSTSWASAGRIWSSISASAWP